MLRKLPWMVEQDSARVRVAVVNVSRLLGDVMSSIMAGEFEAEVVSEVRAGPMLRAVAAFRPDVVILGNETGRAEDHIGAIQAGVRTVRVIAVNADGRSATIYDPGLAPRWVADVSPPGMLSLIRNVGGKRK
ncbi:MAG: hypothetical protein HC861_07755 [Rhodospirillaceae bacterium]|nr:hypothetical protein [Rhodospirillaceae bacterium]